MPVVGCNDVVDCMLVDAYNDVACCIFVVGRIVVICMVGRAVVDVDTISIVDIMPVGEIVPENKSIQLSDTSDKYVLTRCSGFNQCC
jgi:hypothetical protein